MVHFSKIFDDEERLERNMEQSESTSFE